MADSFNTPAPRRSGESGFILVVVLGICLLLALFLAIYASSVQMTVRGASTRLEVARAEGLADAGIALARADLGSGRGDGQRGGLTRTAGWQAPYLACDLPGAGRVAVSVTGEAGKVDLNTASEALLTQVFIGLGASGEEAARYVAHIADYRDADDETRAQGAEAKEYEASGSGLPPPRNSPFMTINEIDRVLGLPEAIREGLKPLATVHSGASGIDPDTAAPELLTLLVQQGAAMRPEFVSRAQSQVVEIRALGATAAGARFLRSAVIDVADGDDAYLSWRQTAIGPHDKSLVQAIEQEVPPC